MVQKLLKSNKKIKALLVIQSQYSDFEKFSNDYLKSIVCENGICNECDWCKKIDTNQYFDSYQMDFKAKNVKKEDILNLITKLNSNALESKGIKFLIIKNIDYASKLISNSLLKFVEEPPHSTYMIFSTSNINNVIPTIKSRCFSLILPSGINEVEELLNKYNLNEFQKNIAKQCFNDLSEFKTNLEIFVKLFDFYKKIINDEYFNFISEIFAEFKELEYKQIKWLIRIIKFADINQMTKYSEIENSLYLNTNKTLIFNELMNVIHKGEF